MNAPAALLLALLALPQQPAPAPSGPGEVLGTVRAEDGHALAWALVELRSEGVRLTALADADGTYRLRRVPAGLHRVRAVHVGHDPAAVEVFVPDGGAVRVDLSLSPRPVEMAPLVVRGDPLEVPEPTAGAPPDRERALAGAQVDLRALGATPGLAESGVASAAAGLPGNEPNEPGDVLLMRGSATDLKLVLLDGAPVYTPFHLGGLLESFDPDVLGAATLHVGGAPARYDGGLSYVLDLRTRRPRTDGPHGRASLDLVGAAASFESPLGDAASVLLSGRALHGLDGRLLGGEASPYGYGDGLVRLEAEPARGHRLSLTGFANSESVYLDFTEGGAAATAAGPVALPEDASWGNHAVAASWGAELGATALEVSASTSRYRAELPIRPPPTSTRGLLLARGETERSRVAVDASRPWAGGAVRLGVSADHTGVSYGARRLEPGSPTGSDAHTSGTGVGVYVDAGRPVGDGVSLRGGARLDRFTTDGGVRLAPRAAVLWNLTDGALLTLAAGRYHQLVRGPDHEVREAAERSAEGAVDPATTLEPLLRVATADHLVLSLDQDLTPRVRLGLEGFLKLFDGLGDAGEEGLTSSGVDLRVAREGDDLTAWLGYSLSWYWSDAGATGSSSTTEFTGRHLLTAGLRGRLAGPVGGDFRLSFSDGLPYTAVATADRGSDQLDSEGGGGEGGDVVEQPRLADENPALAGPLEGFLRLDASVHGEWSTRWGGRRVHIRPYLRLLNALDRRDALFYYFEPWRDEGVRPLADLSVLPVFGVEWRF